MNLINQREIPDNMPNRTVVIPDLHGNFEAYINIMKATWLINSFNKRIWWDTHVIFLWDILFDRHWNWLKILFHIISLKKIASKKWWNIELLFWNHEEMLISFLESWILPNINYLGDIYNWYSEIASLIWLKWEQWKSIIKYLSKSKRGKKLIEWLKQFKLLSKTWNIIFTHTEINSSMVNSILENWIDVINKEFRQGILNILNWWEESKILRSLRRNFLNSDFRQYFDRETWKKLINDWTRISIHWHSKNNWNLVQKIHRLTIVNIDSWYWKDNDLNSHPITWAEIDSEMNIFIYSWNRISTVLQQVIN